MEFLQNTRSTDIGACWQRCLRVLRHGNRTYTTGMRMLAATQAYNLRLEKQRVQSHISDFAAPLQKAMAQHHMGDLDRKIHRLASSGLPQ